jgi:hypothetical protein
LAIFILEEAGIFLARASTEGKGSICEKRFANGLIKLALVESPFFSKYLEGSPRVRTSKT